MGLYSKHIFPRLLDWSLGTDMINEQRLDALAPLRGHVLEIGFGTGLNLKCYPKTVTKVTAIDSESMLTARVAKRMSDVTIPLELIKHDAGLRMPFEDQAFDGVATTFTLCSISNVGAALAEIRRVLNKRGDYVFLEHGRSDNARVAKYQDFFNPVQRLIGCGCNMNRPIDKLISIAGMEILEIDRYALAGTPRIWGEMYRGRARVSGES